MRPAHAKKPQFIDFYGLPAARLIQEHFSAGGNFLPYRYKSVFYGVYRMRCVCLLLNYKE